MSAPVLQRKARMLGQSRTKSGSKSWRCRLTARAAAFAMIAGVLPLAVAQPASASSVSSVSVSISPATAGSTSTYTVAFKAASALSAGSGTVTFNASGSESGTVFPSAASDYVITDSTHSSGSGTVTAAPTLANSNSKVTFTVPKAIVASDSLSVAVSGVTNPPAASTTQIIAVSTSADTTAVNSPDYSVTNSANGAGTETVSPTSVLVSSSNTLTFTYTAASGGLSSGAVTIAAPAGWSAPSTSSGTAGYTTASTGTVSAAGQVVTVSGVTLTSGSTLTVTYGAGGGASSALAPSSAGTSTFTTQEKSTSSGTLTNLASSPTVTVSGPPGVTSVTPNAGPLAAGTSVTVSGNGFLGATAVDFGSVPATSFSVYSSGTSITATAPAEQAGVVDVTVTTPGGTSSTSPADQYTYTPAPAISGLVASPPGLLPAGGQATVSASVTNGSECTWSISPAVAGYPSNGACSSPDTTNPALPANTSSSTEFYTVTLSATGPGGQSSASTDVSVGATALETAATQTVNIDPGAVTTYAGSGTSGFVNGQGTQASFERPVADVVVAGVLYVDDVYGIREVNLSTGQVSTLSGQYPSWGCTNSTNPNQVTMDESGLATDGVNLYSLCASSNGYLLRSTSIASGATSTVANVGFLYGQLTVGSDGAAYITDGGRDSGVTRVDLSTGAVTQYLPSTAFSGQCTFGIAADANDLWIASAGYWNGEDENCNGGPYSLYEVPVGEQGTTPVLVSTYSAEMGEQTLLSAGSYLYADAGAVGGTANVDVARISKTNGSMVVMAGSGAQGHQDGTGLNAWFGSVAGIASDGTNLWVGDWQDYDVREVVAGTPLPVGILPSATQTVSIDPGQVTTFAGSGTSGHVDGNGTSASFSDPESDVVVGGYLYVDDYNTIRKVNLTTGAVSTLAGQASTTGCTDSTNPAQVTMQDSGLASDGVSLYSLCYNYGYYLRRTDIATGATSTVAYVNSVNYGQLTVGPNGDVYVTSGGSVAGVYQVDPTSGTVTSYLSSSAFPGQCAYGIAADANDLWVTASGWYGGQSGEECGLAPFNLYEVPWGEQSPTPSLVDTYSSEVAQSVLVSAGNYLYTDAQYNQTSSDELAQISKATGALAYIAGSGSSGLQDGTGLNAWFDYVGGLAPDGTNLWVADTYNFDIREVTAGTPLPIGLSPTTTKTLTVEHGDVSTFAGNGTSATVNGTGTSASFASPGAEVVVGGNLYVDDHFGIRKVSLATGAVSTLAGQAGVSGCADSTNPADVTMDESSLATDGVALYSVCTSGYNNYVERTVIATGATSSLFDSGYDGQITIGPDGNIYMTTGNYDGGLFEFNVATGSFTQYLPSAAFSGGQCVIGVTVDANYLWVVGDGYYNQYWGEECADAPYNLYKVPVGVRNPTPTLVGTYSTEVGENALISAGNYLYGDATVSNGSSSGPGIQDSRDRE